MKHGFFWYILGVVFMVCGILLLHERPYPWTPIFMMLLGYGWFYIGVVGMKQKYNKGENIFRMDTW